MNLLDQSQPTQAQIDRLSSQLKENSKILEILLDDRKKASWLIDFLNTQFLLHALWAEFYKDGFSEKRMLEILSKNINPGSKQWVRARIWLENAKRDTL